MKKNPVTNISVIAYAKMHDPVKTKMKFQAVRKTRKCISQLRIW